MKYKDIILLSIAVVSVSTAAILVRLADVGGVIAATWRLIIGSLITLALAISIEGSKVLKPPKARDLALMMISGVFLSLHFILWMISLFHLSIATSVTIVTTYPAFLAFIESLIYRERYKTIHLIGGAIAFIGSGLLALYSQSSDIVLIDGDPYLGVILSFLGMLAVSGYFLIGRSIRQRYSTWKYTLYVYTSSAITSLIISISLGYNLIGYGYQTYLYLVLLGLIPMIGGHTVLNYLVKRIRLYHLTLPILGEPIGSSILAYIIFGETIDYIKASLMALTLTGIGLAFYRAIPVEH